jgi:Ca2+-binding RTX toxin-like protein
MSILTIGNAYPGEVTDLMATDFIGALLNPSSTRTSTLFVTSPYAGDFVSFVGTGFTYDASDHLIGGTITSMSETDAGVSVFDLTGLNIPVATTTTNDAFRLAAFSGADTMTGNADPQILYGFQDNDSLSGLGGPDTLYGGMGNDTLDGGTGDDILDGNLGTDRLLGNDGNDVLYQSGALTGAEILNGGAGVDTLRAVSTGAATLINFALGSTLTSIERLQFDSSAGAMQVVVPWGQVGPGLSSTAEVIGGSQADTLTLAVGVGGDYTIPNFTYTNWTPPVLDGSMASGDIVILSGNGAANFVLRATADHFGVQVLIGGTGNDLLVGSQSIESLVTTGGADTLQGGGGNDNLSAYNNNGSFNTFASSVFDGGGGVDYLTLGGHIDFRGSISGIEGLGLLPEVIGAPGRPVAQITVGSGFFNALPSNLTLRGVGEIELDMDAATFNGSQFVFEAGSAIVFGIEGTEW